MRIIIVRTEKRRQQGYTEVSFDFKEKVTSTYSVTSSWQSLLFIGYKRGWKICVISCLPFVIGRANEFIRTGSVMTHRARQSFHGEKALRIVTTGG